MRSSPHDILVQALPRGRIGVRLKGMSCFDVSTGLQVRVRVRIKNKRTQGLGIACPYPNSNILPVLTPLP